MTSHSIDVITALFFNHNVLMRYVADVLKRGGIGICIIHLPDGATEVRTWDRPLTLN